MIIRKTERYYNERKKTWLKHSRHEYKKHIELVKRTTIWVLFIPVFYIEKVISSDI